MQLSRRGILIAAVSALAAGCGISPHRASTEPHVWGRQGRRNGAFVKPRAIAAGNGEVFVIDTTGRVQVFDEAGAYLRGWSLPEYENGTPTCITFDRKGRVLIPDTHYSRILLYSREGELLGQWGSYGSGLEQFIYPTGIVEGPDGTWYISEYGLEADRVHVLDADRRFLKQWGAFGQEPGQLNRAMAIAMDPAATLYVVDTGNHRVQKFNTDGELLGVIGGPGTGPGQLKDPFDLALGPDGSFYICEYGNHRISRFTTTGELMQTYGGPGRTPGLFHGPRGVAVSSSGFLFVADTDNHRVQRMSLKNNDLPGNTAR